MVQPKSAGQCTLWKNAWAVPRCFLNCLRHVSCFVYDINIFKMVRIIYIIFLQGDCRPSFRCALPTPYLCWNVRQFRHLRGQTGTNTLALCTYRFSHIVCHMRDAHHTKLSSLHSRGLLMSSWYTSISSHFTSIPISAAHHTFPAYHLSIVQHSRLTCNYRSAHLT